MRRVSKEDLWGIYYVRAGPRREWDSYYSTIAALRPLLELEEFGQKVSGFYLNIGNHEEFSVRISYFVDESNVSAALTMFSRFFKENAFVEVQKFSSPIPYVVAGNYGGEEFEERFRNFLNLETQIGLELLNADLLNARCLFATYRWQVRKALLPVDAHFTGTFRRCSSTWNSLSDGQRKQFFVDFQERPNPNKVEWGHLMVNFVLAADWFNEITDPHFYTPGMPLSISQINTLVKNLGFQIPSDWKP